jgi:hypothetical protein
MEHVQTGNPVVGLHMCISGGEVGFSYRRGKASKGWGKGLIYSDAGIDRKPNQVSTCWLSYIESKPLNLPVTLSHQTLNLPDKISYALSFHFWISLSIYTPMYIAEKQDKIWFLPSQQFRTHLQLESHFKPCLSNSVLVKSWSCSITFCVYWLLSAFCDHILFIIFNDIHTTN